MSAAVLGKRTHPDDSFLELYYFISGENSSHAVTIKIASTDLVRTLKGAIKGKRLVSEKQKALEDYRLELRSLVSGLQKPSITTLT